MAASCRCRAAKTRVLATCGLIGLISKVKNDESSFQLERPKRDWVDPFRGPGHGLAFDDLPLELQPALFWCSFWCSLPLLASTDGQPHLMHARRMTLKDSSNPKLHHWPRHAVSAGTRCPTLTNRREAFDVERLLAANLLTNPRYHRYSTEQQRQCHCLDASRSLEIYRLHHLTLLPGIRIYLSHFFRADPGVRRVC
ncbi:hypothetical protein BDZ85DRAFT_81256 [Elsinoe ampelina]|uniref:Uncharacterized protein n=1 Tax=Elsinoe ampelina TaxID=302913 RepID=A0A6A6FYJ2_9PEZI|nr:hypothetical protein BDZ85DRAFT_81256 [Elsinoe ampelina]